MPPDAASPAPRKRLPIATWHTRPTTDHAGARAHTVWFGTSTAPPPAASFQLYTTIPAPADPAAARAAALSHARLVVGGADFLSRHGDVSPRFDVHEGLPDVLACVQHQRREIRARQGSAGEVPRFAASAYEMPRGLVVVLTAEIGGGKVEREESDGEGIDGPVFVWFERDAGGGKVRVPQDLEVEEGGELALERVEVVAVRVRAWGSVEGEMTKVRMERDEEGGERKEEEMEEEKRDEEREEKGQEATTAASLRHIQSSFKVNASGNRALIVHNTTTASPSEAHLHYLVYLTGGTENLADDNDLFTVARSFLSGLLAHLSAATTVLLEFHRAPTLAASIQHFRDEQTARPDLSVGYLAKPADGNLGLHQHHRIFPSSPNVEASVERQRAATAGAGAQQSGFSTFFVALESRNWEREDVVLLVRAGADAKTLGRVIGKTPDDERARTGSTVEILIGRPPGLKAVAKRLAGVL